MLTTRLMKNTKVQNPWAYCISCPYQHACAEIFPRLALYVWCCQFLLHHRLASFVGIIFWAKLDVADDRWVTAGAALCIAEKADHRKASEAAYWLFCLCFLNAVVSGISPQIFDVHMPLSLHVRLQLDCSFVK